MKKITKSTINFLYFKNSIFVFIILASIFNVAYELCKSANLFYFYTPDSWYYIALVKNDIFNFSNTTNIIRQYHVLSNYNISFPIGWPVVIGIIDLITNQGWKSPLWGNFISFIAIIIVLYKFQLNSKNKFRNVALICILIISANFYLIDLKAGHSSALFSLLLLTTFYIIYKNIDKQNTISDKDNLIIGLLLGSALLVRNETLMYFPLFLIFLLIYRNLKLEKSLLWAGIIYMPNLILNYINTKHFMISDNDRALFTPFDTHNTDYLYMPDPKFIDNIIPWLGRIKNHTDMFLSILKDNQMIFLILFLVVIISLTFITNKLSKKNFFIVTVTIYSFMVTSIFILITGYNASRYFMLFLILSSLVITLISNEWNVIFEVYKKKFKISTITLLIFLLLIFSPYNKILNIKKLPNPFVAQLSDHPVYKDYEILNNCLNLNKKTRTLVLFDAPHGGTDLSYIGNVITSLIFFPPNNGGEFSEKIWKNYISENQIDSIYILGDIKRNIDTIKIAKKNECSDRFFTIN